MISVSNASEANKSIPQSEVIGQLPDTKMAEDRPRANSVQWRAGAIELPMLCLIVGAALIYGWLQRSEGHLTAENGAGYYLGIGGSFLMLALLLYPLRKRIRALRIIGSVRPWFRIHMLLGVIGPALILLHSNFSMGSLNSTIALICMLIVAGSGFIGRFFYSRIHRGLYGRKAHVREFLNDAGIFKASLLADDPGNSRFLESLQEYEDHRLLDTPGLALGIWRALTAGFAGRRIRKQVLKNMRLLIDQRAAQENWSKAVSRTHLAAFRKNIDSYIQAVSRAEAFTLYERLFSLWHMLHLPLFIILVFATLVHVIAVHLY